MPAKYHRQLSAGARRMFWHSLCAWLTIMRPVHFHPLSLRFIDSPSAVFQRPVIEQNQDVHGVLHRIANHIERLPLPETGGCDFIPFPPGKRFIRLPNLSQGFFKRDIISSFPPLSFLVLFHLCSAYGAVWHYIMCNDENVTTDYAALHQIYQIWLQT